MDLDAYLAAVERDGRVLGDLARGDLDVAVPSCPGWNLANLVGHVGRVYAMVAGALATGSRPDPLPDPPAPSEVADWYDARRADLLAQFEAVDPDRERWNWSVGPQVASFWWRRMAHETSMHLWDAQNAVGDPEPIDPGLASDGIDEWFDVHLRSDLTDPELPVPDGLGTLHVHCGDVEGEWWAAISGRELELRRAHEKGDAVMRGAASDLLLALWRRVPTSAVEVLGDAATVDRWLALPDI